jgi:hypothetical protein
MPGGDTKRSIELQDRDAEILRGLFDSRLMTLAHAAAIHFDGRQEAAKKRIQKLKAAGLIGERKRKVYEPSILFLKKQGFALLKERGLLEGFPLMTLASIEKRLQVSDLTIRHELEVMDVKAAFTTALREHPTSSLSEFSTWPVLFQFRASPDGREQLLVKPDAFVRIQERDGDEVFEHTFFVEVDRSTETLDTLARKALCYLDYYRSGGLSVRAGRPKTEFKDFPFRVLMIFKSQERRDNVAKKLLAGNPPILTQVWLTTITDATTKPIGKVWIRPKDYSRRTGIIPTNSSFELSLLDDSLTTTER